MAAERYTRCPQCASVYRVLPWQLQQAQGCLRCGHCQHAFDATGRVVLMGPDDAAQSASAAERLDLESLLHVEDKGASSTSPSAAPAAALAPAFSADLLAFEQALASFPMPQAPVLAPVQGGAAEDDDAPERAAHRTPLASWAVACLLVLLLAQTVWATRAQWVVHWPTVGQWAQAACDRLGCAWWPWHEPRVLTLEHAHLSRIGADHELQWVVHNQAAWPAAMPSLELTLVDVHEQVVLRRVFSPTDQQGPKVLAPLAHWSGALHWRVPADVPVAGYRLRLFYP